MGEGDKGGWFNPWWNQDEAAWRERFKIVYDITSVAKGRDKPLPRWTEKDVQEFVASDPVYGPQLQLVRQGAKIAIAGSALGGLATALVTLRYSKSGFGAVLAATAGGVVGWTLGEEVATYSLGLYKFRCIDSNLKFLDWWGRKNGK